MSFFLCQQFICRQLIIYNYCKTRTGKRSFWYGCRFLNLFAVNFSTPDLLIVFTSSKIGFLSWELVCVVLHFLSQDCCRVDSQVPFAPLVLTYRSSQIFSNHIISSNQKPKNTFFCNNYNLVLIKCYTKKFDNLQPT